MALPDDMVKDAPSFKTGRNEIKQYIENCDLGGYNSNRSDIPILMEEFPACRDGGRPDGQAHDRCAAYFYSVEPTLQCRLINFIARKNW